MIARPAASGDHPAPLANARIAIIMLMAAETMLFTALIGAYLVLRGAAVMWPPLGQPRLPLEITWVNTGVLGLSCFTAMRARRALAQRDARGLLVETSRTALLGSTFLTVQGFEWVRLLRHGLNAQASVYGGTFYVLVGLHGLHVLAAVAWLLVLVARFRGNRFRLSMAASTDISILYWYYVCGLWAFLFPLVYLV